MLLESGDAAIRCTSLTGLFNHGSSRMAPDYEDEVIILKYLIYSY